MTHFDAYMRLVGDGTAPLDLELTVTQRLEISHHINNPLAVIQLTLQGMPESKERDRMLRNVERIAAYVKAITGSTK